MGKGTTPRGAIFGEGGEKMDPREHLNVIPLFQGFSAAALAEISLKLAVVDFPAGTVILEEGGERKGFFVILAGQVRVVKNYGRRTERHLNLLGENAYFGEMSLLDAGPPSATVLALTPVHGCTLAPGDFQSILASHPALASLLLSNLSRRIRSHEEAGMRELIDAQEAVIISLAKLTEYRDPETGSHLERIRHYCRILALAARSCPDFAEIVDGDFVDMIFMASPLHDIGKVGIPDTVLHAPRRLSSEEIAVMQRHPLIGAATIRQAMAKIPGVSFLAMGHDIALGHHERIDGGGYPRGIAGDAIPLSARIMAVADVYDAFRSDRVYRKGLTHEETRKIIIEGCGTQFDHRLVDLFLAYETDVAAVHERTLAMVPAGERDGGS